MQIKKIHAYTILQVFLAIVVFTCKLLPFVQVGFPILLIFCVPLRIYILPKFYTASELEAVSLQLLDFSISDFPRKLQVKQMFRFEQM